MWPFKLKANKLRYQSSQKIPLKCVYKKLFISCANLDLKDENIHFFQTLVERHRNLL